MKNSPRAKKEYAAGARKARNIIKLCEKEAEEGKMKFDIEIPKPSPLCSNYAIGIDKTLEKEGFTVNVDYGGYNIHVHVDWSEAKSDTNADILRKKAEENSSYVKNILKGMNRRVLKDHRTQAAVCINDSVVVINL